jgi:hypothetical protein
MLALPACSVGEEQLSPVPPPGVPDDAGAVTPPPPGVPPIPGRVKRTVMERSPFGGTPGNLLADGDFELSTVPHAGSQLGWRAYTLDGSGELDTHWETGGLCRSGLRCAIFDPGMLMFGRGTASATKGNVASVWAKLPINAKCNLVRPILITCDTFNVDKLLSGGKKDANGWCHYTAALPRQDSALCMYIDSTLKAATYALLDDAVIGPDDGTIHPEAAEFWVPDAQTVATLENLRRVVQSTMPLGRGERRARPAR